ncbi:hypothetical protein EDD85DRAFT_990032 [Armillaria nabsnona]|nr:hypothetical protein EDD85DRAFT_990032 [Armillaria nabsnona]
MSNTTDRLSPDFLCRVCDEYLNVMFVKSFTHGMYTFIFIVALTKLFSKHSTQKYIHRNILFMVLFVMYTLATVHLAFCWKLVRSSFVIHGPEHFRLYHGATFPQQLSVTDTELKGQIWHCWTFWNWKWRMTIVPMLCTIGGTIFNIFYIIQNFNALGMHPFQGVIGSTNWAIAYYFMTLSTMIICTALILYPMVTTEAPSRPKTCVYTYHRVIVILVESSSLYAFSLILLLMYLIRNDLMVPYPQVILSSVTIWHCSNAHCG